MPVKSLFHEQEEAEDKVLVDGLRLYPAHVEGYQKLRSVLKLTSAQAKDLIERWDTVETICAQACLGQLLPVAMGRIVNEKFKELTS